MLIGIIGKPSSGKTTLLNALCMTEAKTGAYPFTTIEANRGVAYISMTCPCTTIAGNCTPRTGRCENGMRYIPIELLDVAGLVPGASEGKGMGNRFLDDLRQADVLIHVVDASGSTDAEGNEVASHDPSEDVVWLNDELDAWIGNIVFANWDRLSKKIDAERTKLVEILNDKLSGLGSTPTKIRKALMHVGLMDASPRTWTEGQRIEIGQILRDVLFPMIIAANKIDKQDAETNEKALINNYPTIKIIGTSGLAELTLRKLHENGVIVYVPGNNDFKIMDPDHKQVGVANAIKEKLLDVRGSTGVSDLLHHATYDLLELVAVYPVEDTTHLTDKDGKVLPDAFLVRKGTTAKEFAAKIHTDLGKSFIHGILVNKNNKRIAASYEVEHGDIIKVVAALK